MNADEEPGEYRRVCDFLFHEANLLDEGRLAEWLGVLADDIAYRLVTPTVAMSRDAANEVVLLDENLASLKTRVKQLTTPSYTVAENPRSFTRRFVANILIDAASQAGSVQVRSNVLIYRGRGTEAPPHLFSMSRIDCLARSASGFLLARRTAKLDEAVIGARTVANIF